MKLKILPSNVLFEQFDIQENELEKRLANLPKFGDTIQDFTLDRKSVV